MLNAQFSKDLRIVHWAFCIGRLHVSTLRPRRVLGRCWRRIPSAL